MKIKAPGRLIYLSNGLRVYLGSTPEHNQKSQECINTNCECCHNRVVPGWPISAFLIFEVGNPCEITLLAGKHQTVGFN